MLEVSFYHTKFDVAWFEYSSINLGKESRPRPEGGDEDCVVKLKNMIVCSELKTLNIRTFC